MLAKEIVVFDFDGTLISKDAGFSFNYWLIRRSLLRSCIMMVFLQVLFLFLLCPKTIKFALNIGCFIATVGQKTSLFHLRSGFIDHYFNSYHAEFFQSGLQELLQQQQAGRQVAILTGCPYWLLQGILKRLGLKNITMVASSLKLCCGALILDDHCYAANKVIMAEKFSELSGHWLVGYTDSSSDIPMLEKCHKKVLVNVGGKTHWLFTRKLSGFIEQRTWS